MLAPRWQAVGGLGAIGALAALLVLWPPGPGVFYPPCPLQALTGLHCPGCGSTRMLGAVVHGEWRAAWHFNPLALLALLPLLGWGLRQAWLGLRENRFARSEWSPRATRAVLWIVIVYGVARNLPWAPFCWLAPRSG